MYPIASRSDAQTNAVLNMYSESTRTYFDLYSDIAKQQLV